MFFFARARVLGSACALILLNMKSLMLRFRGFRREREAREEREERMAWVGLAKRYCERAIGVDREIVRGGVGPLKDAEYGEEERTCWFSRNILKMASKSETPYM